VYQASDANVLPALSRSFATALFPCKKDEDRVHVSGGIPGICDAVLQLYDGRGCHLDSDIYATWTKLSHPE
jgi:hypothetical protein